MDIYDEANKIRSKIDGINNGALGEKERVLLCVVELEMEINNGGFDQYYYNISGDFANFAPVALEIISANEMANITRRANAVFGESVPENREARQKYLLGLGEGIQEMFDGLDNEFYRYPDDIAHLLNTYMSTT